MKTFIKQLLLVVMMFLVVESTGCKNSHRDSDSGKSKSKKSKSKKDKKDEDDAEDYDTAVRELLEAMDYEQNTRANLYATYSQMGFDAQYTEGLVDDLLEKMPDKMVEIYSNHFTVDEIKQLTKINGDPIFKKQREYLTQIYQDFMQEGRALATGEPSPSANIDVSSDFEAAMRDYLDAEEFDKQLEQLKPIMQQNYSSTYSDFDSFYESYCAEAPDMMVRIYSKYFSTSDIKKLTAFSKMHCSKEFRDKAPAITQEAMEATRPIVESYIKNHPIR
ncbi:MAG: DUF2059 domain-containing protein [Muribaculaceae bacterium]|nr:DUF2059 domain-containing protein [Muribaculaceae bacterium]